MTPGPLGLPATPSHDEKHQTGASPPTTRSNSPHTDRRDPTRARTLLPVTVADPPSPHRPARQIAAGAKMQKGARVKNGTGQEVGMAVLRVEASGHVRSAVSP